MAKTKRRIFIGHGRSTAWEKLRDFIRDQLQLEWEEFSRVSAAGRTAVARLEAMLNTSCFAFLVMTAEDEHADGGAGARHNVIHEAGLFQGRLGFERAIIVLEEGCEKFSNIAGLQHIPFGKGNIESAFDGVRRVLEREHVVASPRRMPPDEAVSATFRLPGRNSHFSGRNEHLATLRRSFESREGRVIQALVGLAGIGKTQVALEYAHRHCGDYKHVLWIRADTEANLKKDFASIGKGLGVVDDDVDAVVRAAKAWLERGEGWLIILDDVVDPRILEEYIPGSSFGHILLTSQGSTFDEIGAGRPLRLQPMPPEDAVAFLFQRTKCDARNADELKAAQELAYELEGHPLALEQAAAYVITMGVTLSSYLATYRRVGLKHLEEQGPRAGGYRKSLAAAWKMTLDQLEQAHPASADILRFSAFLDHKRIPFELVTDGAGELGPLLSRAFVAADEDVEVALNKVFRPLRQFSLIELDYQNRSFTIPRLLQAYVKTVIEEQGVADWLLRTVRALNRVFPAVEFENWRRCERLLPHAHHVAHLVGRSSDVSNEAVNEIGRMHLDLANAFCRELNDLDESLRHYEEGLRLRYGDGERATLEAARDYRRFADLLRMRGDYKGAEREYRHAKRLLDTEEKKSELGKLLSSMADLYVRHARYSDSALFLKKALDAGEGSLRLQTDLKDRFEVFQSLRVLADVFMARGELDAAEKTIHQAIEIGVEEDHRQMGWALRTQGELHQLRHQTDSALKSFHEALTHFTRRGTGLGEAVALHKIGLVHLSRGDVHESLTWLGRAVEAAKRLTGTQHLLAEVQLSLARARALERVERGIAFDSAEDAAPSNRHRGIALGIASSVSASGNAFDLVEALRYAHRTGFSLVQIYLDPSAPKDADVYATVTDLARHYNIEVMCHAAGSLAKDWAEHERDVTQAKQLFACSERRWVVEHFDEKWSVEDMARTVRGLVQLGIAPCIENFHRDGGEDVRANYERYLGLFERLSDVKSKVRAVMDISRLFNKKLALSSEEASGLTISVLNSLRKLGIRVLLHLIDSRAASMEREDWCPLGEGVVPYATLLNGSMAADRVEAIILEYEDKKNPLLSWPFLEVAIGEGLAVP